MEKSQIQSLIEQQNSHFLSHQTRSYDWRVNTLEKLRQTFISNEEAICQALMQDLGRPKFEALLAETSFVIGEIEYALKYLKKWMKPKKASIPLMHKPASGAIHYEPFGVCVIIGPWNYPYQLLASPLVGAIAAGNTAILKPSEMAPETSALIARMIKDNFDPKEIAVVEGGIPETTELISSKSIHHIFYTGSTQVGKIVMEKAAKNLTPVTLELGGKSPCIIDGECDFDLVAKRILWGKSMNAGQTCVAPDYLLISPKYRDSFVEAYKRALASFYPEGYDKDFSKIVNQGHFERIKGLLDGLDPNTEKVLVEGELRPDELKITPYMVLSKDDGVLMESELFGPILPIVEKDGPEEMISFINSKPRPLALYVFSSNQSNIDKVVRETSSGGVCVNDVILHLGVPELPFGGVGASGMGGYHGEASFHTFSHKKSVMRRHLWLDNPLRYPPYTEKKFNLIKKILNLLG